MKAKCVIDMWHGEKYDPKKHCVPGIHWSDGRLIYWGWIHAGEKGEIVGDFTAESAQDAEKALGVKWRYA